MGPSGPLAAIRPNGGPHNVPVCPVLDERTIVFASDGDSAKIRNLRADFGAALVFDDCVEDWTPCGRFRYRGRLGSSRPVVTGSEADACSKRSTSSTSP